MRAFEHTFHGTRSLAATVAQMTAALLRAIHALVAALCSLLGLRAPAMPQMLMPSTTPEDVRNEYRAARCEEDSDDHAFTSDVGMAVHQYASQPDPAIRSAVDLTGLSDAQTDWLLGLGDNDLQRLAAAGPRACELAVTGKRSGIVGMTGPEAVTSTAVPDAGNRVRDMLVERIRSTQSAAPRAA